MNSKKIGSDQLAALGLSLVVASLAVGFLAIGCGKQQSETAAIQTGAVPAAAVAERTDAREKEALPVASLAAATPAVDDMAEVSADSLPPDVVASASESLVSPGEIVEIAAEGSLDVVTVTLTDGLGKSYPLAYDPAAKCWRALYRVPLRTTADRVGLSVTAKNGLDRWRRVWIFLNVERGGAPADSGSGS
ncbi:MAG: hypothetical protein HY568_05995 [Candidatus Latescibacteria bacterium]|nr:hypothetical protein [Candidatus Latescibacterota bacterium]